jgi:hypothetical protein
LNFTGNQSLDASDITLYVRDFGLDALIAKETFLVRDPERREIDDNARKCDPELPERLGRAHLRDRQREEQQRDPRR